MLNSRCQDLNVFGYITVDQSEDPVPFFKVTWVVMYYKKGGRLVLAVPCKFTCHAVGWKYWFIEPARLERNSNSKLLHFNLYVKICKLFLTDMTFLLLFFFNCLYSQNFEMLWVHYLVYFCFNVFGENNYLMHLHLHDRVFRLKNCTKCGGVNFFFITNAITNFFFYWF